MMHRFILFSLFVFTQPMMAQIDLSLYGEGGETDSTAQIKIESLLDAASIDELLPPLSQLIDTAIVYSPEIRAAEAMIHKAEYRESEIRRDYWNAVVINGQYAYGNNLFVGGNQLQPLSAPLNIQQIGIGVSMPLDIWINRSNRVGQMVADVEQLKAERDLRIRTLKNELTQLYLTLLMLKKQLIIVGEGAQIAVAIKESMEMDFSKGAIDFQQTATGMNYWQTSNFNYESLSMQFSNTYLTLQRLVGLSFDRFSK